MITLTSILNQEIVGETFSKICGMYQVQIIHKSTCTYSDGKTREDEDEIMTFAKWFNSEAEAQDWMKKDKVFKAALKAAQKYTKPYTIK